MANLSNLNHRIQEKRMHMHWLVSEKASLLDPEVLEISRMLDGLLNELESMNKKKGL